MALAHQGGSDIGAEHEQGAVGQIGDSHQTKNQREPGREHEEQPPKSQAVEGLKGPDLHVLPVGNAGNITAYWKGYKEYNKDRISTKLPQMWGFQAAGAAPIVLNQVVSEPETIATAIRIGNPASWEQAVDARDSSGGLIDSVTDEEILSAYRLVAAREGVFVEPSSAAGIAGLIKKQAQGQLPKGKKIVITVTGNGLKDVGWILDGAAAPTVIPVDLTAAAAAMGLK